jgi:hypothetical protein
MDEPHLVGIVEANGRLPNVLARLFDWQRSLVLNKLGQVRSVDKLHDQEEAVAGLVGVVGSDNIWVVEFSGRPDFAFE